MGMVPPNPTDFVRQRDFERWQDKYDQRFDAFVTKVDQLTDVVGVHNNRITNVETFITKQGDQGFARSLSATQAAWGCVSAIVILCLSTVTGIIGSLVVDWLTHH